MEIIGLAAVIELVLIVALMVITIYCNVKIANKAGYSGWWVVLFVIPIVNIIMIWIFAYADWPALKQTTNTSSTNP